MLPALKFRSIRPRRGYFTALAVLTLLAGLAPLARAERQVSMNLFPHDTLLFVRTPNAQEFGEKLKETSTGRMMQDPAIKPLIDRVMGEVSTLYTEQAEGQVGIAWNELLKLPKGELAFGIVTVPGGPPGLLLMIDQGNEPTVAHTLLERGLEALKAQGGETTNEKIEGVDVTVVRMGGRQDRVIGVFERDGTIVAATDPSILRNVLWHWDGTKQLPANAEAGTGDDNQFTPTPTLDTNEKFLAIIKECRRPNDPVPNAVLYVDPIELARQFGRASVGVQVAITLLPQLGLDGVRAIGGAMTSSTGQYDTLAQVHVLLENPRTGILSMIAFDTGDNTPQAWVPADTASYITARWKFPAFYARLASIVDQFRGEGSFNEMVGGRVSEQLGVDFKTQIVDNLAGRVTMLTAHERPVTMQSRKQVFAIELNDEAGAKQTLETILAKYPGVTERKSAGPISYHAVVIPGIDQMPEEQVPFHPFIAIMDKHLFIGTSTKLFEQMVLAYQGDAPRLADSKEYDRVAATLSKEAVGLRPAIFMMSRPDLDFEFWYELLTSEQSRTAIEQAAADNEAIERFAKILRDGSVPPFEVFKKYLAPGGAILYDTDNGFHGISYSLRNE